MGFLSRPFPILLSIFFFFTMAKSASDYTTLVYKGCAKQSISDPSGFYSQSLSSLFGSLVSQSSKSKFFKTNTGTGQTTISGLFQCRGDLTNVDCYNCVSKLPTLMNKLCGNQVAARIQLLGCYMMYEVSGFPQISGMELLFKSCNGKNREGSGFEERRDTALSSLMNGIGSGNGFYTTSYQSVYVLGQCEGDVGNGDCVECVKSAVQKAQVECGSSISGQVYLHKCFISYSFYPNGAPKTSQSDSSPGVDAGKTVAIIMGALAGLGFLVICLMVAKNATKKHDDY
ncbi:plasmodesmata-located protein 2-like isoform X2 [Impatiens glandulifera]|uniref:plasmodesmata-located protein 2-like isoform X2 n=1 Tax=Impatiens glandulifera TaxID=253017 RepID=UPI001FB17840|nr:plasmodesmata-located protein 2-like isoform X2 [Impatiens glandulifera]